MIGRIIHWAIHNRMLVLLAAAMLAAWGAWAVRHTPIDAIPDLSDTQVIVRVSYPGQAPQVVEDQVTYPLASALMAVPGSTTVRGYSMFGDSFIYVLFEDGTDPYWARSRVLEYLNQAATVLPPDVQASLGPDATGVGWIFEYALVDESGRHSLEELTSLQNWFLRYELQGLPGVAEVATVGGMVRQYQVIADPVSLRAQGISVAQIKTAIQRGTGESGGGVVEMAEAEYMVRVSGYINDLDDLRNIPLRVNADGVAVTIGDVATVRFGPQLRRGMAEFNGQGEVVGGIIVMRYGGNALSTIEAVKERLAQLESSLPPGVNIVPTYDRSGLILRAVDNLWHKLGEEFLIVTLVCALFLFHLRSALVVAVTLPLGILAAFIVMQAQGINANIMSLGGIAIAIGAMVDAIIVMIENVHKHLEREQHAATGAAHWQIVAKAAQEVGPALFFSLLIIALSFLPVFALQAQEGRMFAPLAFTKTYAMAAAAGLSVTLAPVLMGLFIRGRITPENSNPVNRALIRVYDPAIRFVLRRPVWVVAGALLIIVFSIFPYRQLGSEFMPTLNEGDLLYMPTTFPGMAPGEAQQLLQQTDKMIMQVPEVATVFGKIGRAQTATDPAPLTMIETIIQLKPREQWREGLSMDELIAELDATVQLPGLANAWVMPIKTRIDMLATGIKTPVGIKISGPDLAVIASIGAQVESALRDLPGTASVFAERAASGRYINVDIRRADAARYGLNIADVQTLVNSAVAGMTIATAVEGRERYPINLRFPQAQRDSVQDLRNLPVITAQGASVPLAAVADIGITTGPTMLKSENARLTGWVYVDITGQDLGSYVAAAQQQVAAQVTMPAGYALSWAGQYQYLQRATARLLLIVPATLVIIVLLLYFIFQRFSDVFIVLGALPVALVGGVWLLWLLGYNLSVAVGVGFIALAGVAAETGVLMLVYLNQAWHERRATGQATLADLRAAIHAGAVLRVRPKLMTVTAIIAGLLPIMWGTGTGSAVMRRIAAPMIGGMISATLLTLVVIPALYYLWHRRLLGRRQP